ncbi:protein singed wings 2-like [Penaeus japonicus]|uniref:protein singed wings 2-like n=1 Tax=Penaeus japonicus TaxID=27405 RepID=UPI001C715B4A|nr:protein singed wings 2-like [Penaeus japonicus]
MWLQRCLTLCALTSTTWVRAETPVTEDGLLVSTMFDVSPCHLLEPTWVACEGLLSLDEVTGGIPEERWPEITKLSIDDGRFLTLTLDDLLDLPSLHTLVFNYSQVARWAVPTRKGVPAITHLILDDCWDAEDKTLSLTRKMMMGLKGLEEIQILDCLLLNLEFSVLEAEKPLQLLRIEGGSLVCKNGNLWMLFWLESGQISVSDDTTCFRHTTSLVFHYSFDGHSFLRIMGYLKEAVRDCPRVCSCEVRGIKWTGMPLQYAACEGRGVSTLPLTLPRYTSQLYLTDNNITDIDTLFTNENYRNLDHVILKNNQISYIDGDLFYNYVKNRSHNIHINLSNNRLRTLPIWTLRKVHEDGKFSNLTIYHLVDLRGNPWDCNNCSFVEEFRDFYQELLRHEAVDILTDATEIRCGARDTAFEDEQQEEEEEGTVDSLAGTPFLVTSPEALCPPVTGSFLLKDAIYTILAVALLVFVVGLSYAVHLSKKRGQLFQLLQ